MAVDGGRRRDLLHPFAHLDDLDGAGRRMRRRSAQP
jgi:hypothetical protein